MINNVPCLFLLLALIANTPAAGQVISMEDVLAIARDDQYLSRYQAIRDLANDLKMHDPVVREIALRVGFNGSLLGDTIYGYLRNEDDLRLQVSFNDFAVRRQQKAIKAARVQTLSTGLAVASHSALSDRYEALSDYAYRLPALEALKRLDSLLLAEHEIIKGMLSTGILEVKVSRILDVEEDHNRILLEISESEERIRQAKLNIENYTGSFSSISLERLATIEDIEESLQFFKASGFEAHPAHLALSAEIHQDSAIYRYAAAQNRQILDFVSLGYQRPLYLDRPNKFNTFNNFAFRLGLLVPITANNRYRKADALLDLEESQIKAANARVTHDLAWQREIAILEGLIREYGLARERLDNSLIRQMLSNQTLLAHITPLEIVELEIAQQKQILHQLELAQDIASAYVKILSLSGSLALDPATNYLAKRQN